jgi:hypothetical protein
MTTSRLPKFACAALVCAALIHLSAGDRARAAAAPLATGIDIEQAPPQPTRDGVRRARYIGIDFSVLRAPGQRAALREPGITLELFPDVTIFATFDRYDRHAGGVTWVGHVEGDPMSTVTLVYRGTMMTGSIVTRNATFQIRPAPAEARLPAAGNGRVAHVVTQVDQSTLPREAEPIEVSLTAADIAAVKDIPMRDTADTIDVMVVYTPAARTAVGGAAAMSNLINLAISETNTSYANSGVIQRIRLVHAQEVPYTESNSFSVSLNALRAGTGGLSSVPALREAHGADMVQMLVHPPDPDACGIAFLMTNVSTAFAPNAFSVTDTSCVSPNYTFAHELGHNMGARHDWYVDSGTTPFSYAHGYVNPAVGQRWRTIMAYVDMCSDMGFNCTRLLHWANPERRFLSCNGSLFNCNQLQYWFYPGAPMGVPGGTNTSCSTNNQNASNCDADDRRTLNNTALSIANFRQAVK